MTLEQVDLSAFLDKINAKIKEMEKRRDTGTNFFRSSSDVQALNGEIFWIKWTRDLIRKEAAKKLRTMVRGVGPIGASEATILVNAELFNSLIAELEREN